MQINENSAFFRLILEYIDMFYDKTDIIEDLKGYFLLFSSEEALALKLKLQ